MQLESLPGSILDQKYSIEMRLGEGAMGAVFRATHLGTTRPVAVKVIVPKLAATHEFAQRFKREAEAAGRLIHPNVVNVTDFGVTLFDGHELAYLVMEYLDGQPLSDYLKDNPRPTFSFLLDVMDQTGLALDASHAAGIVHRDLKPSNIWLEPNHRGGYNIKVLDFGIAKVTNPAKQERPAAADALATLAMASPEIVAETIFYANAGNPLATPSNLRTIAGTSLGTPAYMAPEQCANLEVDPRADVYSLAVIAYEMLCGQVPFHAETLAGLMKQQIQSSPPSPREHDRTVPEALAKVVLSGLEKDPAKRPPTAGTFAARLRTASDGELSLIRKSKDMFHAHSGLFVPVRFACLSITVALMIAVRFAAVRAAQSKLAPDYMVILGIGLCSVLCTIVEFQFFKAICALILKHASENGEFGSARAPAFKRLIAGAGALLRTQLTSMVDLRPSSWWANCIWPVVWAAEGRAARNAITRSRDLCETLPTASKNLALRQYCLALIAGLMSPCFIAIIAFVGNPELWVRALSGVLGWYMILYPLMFGFMFVNWGPAFSFLYWSALRCRNEGADIALPAAIREGNRKSSARRLRPAMLLWIAFPSILIASLTILLVLQAKRSGPAQALEEASVNGRRATVLKLIDSGVAVEQQNSDDETPLFDAVRSGDQTLVAELLKRGANANAHTRAGTPLLLATQLGRNDLARVLLDHGASVDAADRDGRTPLMLAGMRGNASLAQLLLDRGADVKRIDTHGKTAAAYATEEGYGELSQLLSRK